MCGFLGIIHTKKRCWHLRNYAIGSICISVIIILSLSSPVSAYYFDFISFETDQLVYEVGETITMVSDLIADFSETGWCYVSFAVVSDMGTAHTDAYYIPASTSVQHPSSSYLISADDTSPGIDGTQAYVMFSAEIYDTFSEGGSDTIIVNITRGHLEIEPLVPLITSYGSDTSFSFRIHSIHNENVVYSNNNISIGILNQIGESVLNTSTITDANGEFSFIWNSSIGPSAIYNMSISSQGDDDFIPFNESFLVTVEPAESILKIVSAPETIVCQSYDGSLFEYAELIVEHLDNEGIKLNDSSVNWSFNSAIGNLTLIGSGFYRALIPFHVNPGLYTINFSATSPNHQNAFNSTQIESVKRDVELSHLPFPIPVADSTFTAHISVDDIINHSGIPSIPVNVTLIINNTVVDNSIIFSNESGFVNYVVEIPPNLYGDGLIHATILETQNNNPAQEFWSFVINYNPMVSITSTNDIILGKNNQIHICITDFHSRGLDNATIELWNPNNALVSTNFTDTQGQCILNWLPDESLSVGSHQYKIVILNNTDEFINQSVYDLLLILHYPIIIEEMPENNIAIRGSLYLLNITITSPLIENQNIDLIIQDDFNEIYQYVLVDVNQNATICLPIDNNFTLGIRKLHFYMNNPNFTFVNSDDIELFVKGNMITNQSIKSAFYSEELILDLKIKDDNMSVLQMISLVVSYDDGSLISIYNVSLDGYVSLPLPISLGVGTHSALIMLLHPLFKSSNITIEFTIFIRTSITITYSIVGIDTPPVPAQDAPIASSISSGLIISPPPTLFNETTSISLLTTRFTSLDSCPKLSSGTSNRSTVLENASSSSSGNGQMVFNLNDFIKSFSESRISSTDLDVEPNDMTPHSALVGPIISKSSRRCEFLRIFSEILRIKWS